MRIRAARAADHPRVTALLRAAGLPLDGVPADLAGFVVVEADRSGDAPVVGAAGLEVYGPAGLLRSTVVDPAHRGAGVGRALVGEVLAAARRQGVRDLYLLTLDADQYFARLGFSRLPRTEVPAGVRVSREFQGACPATAVAMHRRADG